MPIHSTIGLCTDINQIVCARIYSIPDKEKEQKINVLFYAFLGNFGLLSQSGGQKLGALMLL